MSDDKRLDDIREDVKDVKEKISELDKSLAVMHSTLKDHMIDESLDSEELKKITIIMTRNTASLEEHMRRSAALEQMINNTDKRIEPLLIDKEVRELTAKKRARTLKAVGGTIAAITAIIGAILGILTFLK